MSADSREQPILAYSEDNDWSGSSLRGPDIFLKIYGNNIKKIKNKNEKQRVEIGGVWKKLSSVNPKGGAADLIIEPTGCNPDNCNYYSSVATTRFVDALARWGQDFSFNFYSPAKSNCDDCDRIAAGCGPVAVGMLLRYHEFPIMNMSFNGQTAFTDYANMPRFAGGCNNNTGGFRSSAMLIRIAGNVMSSDYGGVFGCETATYPANIGDGLDFFGYSHDGKGKLSDRFFDVQNDLENQFPVIFSGATSPVGNNWHWLADGFQQTSYEQCHNNVCSYYSYSSWSMNWGQHGDGNGWYSTSPNSIDEYDELLRVYTNIRPN